MRRRKRSYVIKDPDAEQRARLWRAWLVQMGLYSYNQGTHLILIKNDGTPPKPMPLDFDVDTTLIHSDSYFANWLSCDGNGTKAHPADEEWRQWKYLIRIENEMVEVYDTQNCNPEYLKDCLLGKKSPHCSVALEPPF